MVNETELDNILVGQKNRIFWLINSGFFSEAQAALDVVRPLWEASSYSYKIKEIESRLYAELAAR
jgi:hypothetical protein